MLGLALMEVIDILLCLHHSILKGRVYLIQKGINLVLVKFDFLRHAAVKPHGVLPHSLVSALFYTIDNGGHRFGDLGVRLPCPLFQLS